MRPTFRQTLQLVRSDLQTRCDYENKRLTKRQIAKFLLHNAVIATVLYRLQAYLYRRGFPALASFLKTINAVFLTVDIDSSSEIGAGLFLMHANYICIGPRVRIGRNCMLAHQNSITPSPFFEAARAAFPDGPTLGDDIMIGAGACLSGEITLGNRVRISMNAAVEQSCPDDSVLFGVPARVMVQSASRTETA